MEKPARYTGGELNAVVKPWDQVKVRVALAFPDIYEIGFSHLGLRLLYHLINEQEDYLAERVYAPQPIWNRNYEKRDYLFTLESQKSLAQFDLVGFTLQYELSYTNILNMLNLAGIP